MWSQAFPGNASVATTQPRQAPTGRGWDGAGRWGESKIPGPKPVLERGRVGGTRRQGLENPTARGEAWRARAPGRACAGPRQGSPALSRPDLGPGSRPLGDVCQRALQTVIALSGGRASPARATHPG